MRRPDVVIGCGLFAFFVAIGAAGMREARGQAPSRDPSLRSTLIYRPELIALRMNHSHPAHRELPCTRCHEGADRSRRSKDSLIPKEGSCLPCHEDRIDRSAPSADRCGYCHVGFGEGGAREVPRSRFPPTRLKFDHALHVRKEGMECLECHAGIETATLGSREHLPTMRSCFRCHGEARSSASGSCTVCHLTLPDGRLRATFPEGWMNPPRWLFGMHHDREWIVRHRWVGADQGPLCSACHTERDCADCHDGRIRPRRIHPNDYLTIHAQQARRNEPRCTSCHTSQTFCNECHARLGISQLAAPRVRAAGRYHPPADVWTRGPVQHAREARRSMVMCSSCHAERDCVQCHGALGIGAGLSPHPPGFAARCGALLRRNDRACQTCHGDVSALSLRCR